MKPFFYLGYWLLLAGACQSPASSDQAGHTHSSASNPAKGEEENYDCRHCGMPSDEFPEWQASLVSKGKTYWFCSPRCMFLFRQNPKSGLTEVSRIVVTDYYERKKIEAQKAYFVMGGDVPGPMGPDLVPHATRAAAEDFMKEHQGIEILTFAQITPKLLQKLTQP
ncbi:MAG: hypothetical protein OHK0053_27830 [Microscillaceae bacterium]